MTREGHVEFVGLPGAGKSTVSQKVFENFQEGGRDVANVTYKVEREGTQWRRYTTKFRYVSSQVFRRPYWVWDSTAKISTSQQPTLRDGIKCLFNWLYVAGVVERYRHSDVTPILDQALVQGMWSTLIAARNDVRRDLEVLLREFFSSVPKPRIVVVDVDTDVASDRLSEREHNPSRVSANGDTEYTISRAQAVFDGVNETLDRLERDRIVSLCRVTNNNPEDLQENTAEILSFIDS